MLRKFRSAIVICMVLTLLLSGCGNGGQNDDTPVETQAVITTQPPTEDVTIPVTEPEEIPQTEAPTTEPMPEETEAPTQQSANVFETLDVTNVNIPLLETIGNAELAEINELDDTYVLLAYTGADQDSFDIFQVLCSFSGLYRLEDDRDDGYEGYYLLKPGYDYLGYTYYILEESVIIFQTMTAGFPLDDEDMAGIMEYYLQDLHFPADFGKNVCPQFYASVNISPFFQNMVGEVDYAFDGAMCWMEMYGDISYRHLEAYISDMLLCGFDIWYDYVDLSEEGCVESCILHLSNGDLELIVSYDAEDKEATVYYEPGVMMNLLSGSDYAAYIPQR